MPISSTEGMVRPLVTSSKVATVQGAHPGRPGRQLEESWGKPHCPSGRRWNRLLLVREKGLGAAATTGRALYQCRLNIIGTVAQASFLSLAWAMKACALLPLPPCWAWNPNLPNKLCIDLIKSTSNGIQREGDHQSG